MEEMKSSIVVGGETTKTGFKTSAYQQIEPNNATHFRATSKSVVDNKGQVKTVETNEFVKITEGMIVKRIDVSNPAGRNDDGEVIHYTEVVPNKKYQYKCIVGDTEYMIESLMFSQIAFMKPDPEGKGTHYRCDDGMYVRKDEVQVPAYKIVDFPTDHDLISATIHDGKHYIDYAKIVINGKTLEVPRSLVVEKDGNYYYEWKDSKGKKVVTECKLLEYKKKTIGHVLLDGDKIVRMDKVSLKPDGQYVTRIGDVEVPIGKTNFAVKGMFIEGTAIGETKEVNFTPINEVKDINNATYSFDNSKHSGITKVITNKTKGYAVIVYGEGKSAHYEIVLKHNTISENDILTWLEGWAKANNGYQFRNFEIKRVDNFEVINAGEQGIKVIYPERSKKDLAQNVEVQDDKVVACTLGGRRLTNIKWYDDLDFPRIMSYEMDGITISDIEWNGERIGKCKVSFTNIDGEERTINIDNLEKSPYSGYAIRNHKNVQVKNLEVNKDENQKTTISFIAGDYKITNAEYDEATGIIGNCTIKKGDGKEQRVDLSKDPRFSHLRAMIEFAFDQERVKPLIESKLVEKKDGKYEKVADVVQTSAMGKDGIATAKPVGTVEEAVDAQKKFEQNPYPTWVMDEQGKIHQLSDLKNTYKGEAEFECESDYFKKLIGKDTIETKNGDIKIDSKPEDKLRDKQLLSGLAFCANPLTLPIGFCFLAAGVITLIAAPIRRAVKERKLRKLTLEDVVNKIRENVKENCQKNIKKIEREFRKRLRWAEKNISSAEISAYKDNLALEFRTKISAEAARMQVFGDGGLNCNFDFAKKPKLSSENMLGWYAGKDKKKELIEGKKADPKFKAKWNELFIEESTNEIDAAGGKTKKQHGKIPRNWEKAIEVLEEFGGRDEYILAHKIRMEHIDELLEETNNHLTASNKMDKETFKNRLIESFMAGKLDWGSIEDKLDVVRQSEAYAGADAKTRTEMLEKTRKQLMKQANTLKVASAEFVPQYDKDGNLMSDVYGTRIMTWAAMFERDVIHGNRHHRMPSFDMDHDAKLSAEEQEIYGTTLSEQICHRASGSTIRRIHHDEKVAQKGFEQVQAEQLQISKEIANLEERAKIMVSNNDYEGAFVLQAEIRSKEADIKKHVATVAAGLKGNEYSELSESREKELMSQLVGLRATQKFVDKKVSGYRMQAQKQYDRMVRDWAYSEFVEQNRDAFKKVVDALKKECPTLNLQDARVRQNLINKFVAHATDPKLNPNEENRTACQEQLDMLMVKNNIEESVVAQVYCEDKDVKADYEKYCEENPEIKPEEAKLRFYSKRKREDAISIDKFKKVNQDKVDERTIKLSEEKKLHKHESKKRDILKGKGQDKAKEEIASAEPISAPDAEVEVGRTA